MARRGAAHPTGLAGALSILLAVLLAVLLVGSFAVVPAAAVIQPGITDMSPAVGPLAGGTQVVLHGGGFTGASVVHFGGAATTHFKVDTDEEMRVFSPTHGAGTVYVTVSNSAGTSIFARQGRFTYAANPDPLVRAGTARTAPAIALAGQGKVEVSCVSAGFCVAGGALGVSRYDGAGWSSVTSLGHTVTQVSCGSPTLCLAATTAGTIWRYDGTAWAVSRDADRVVSISCGPTACAGDTQTGGTDTLLGYDGTTWAAQAGRLTSVDCFAAPDGCVGTAVGTRRNFADGWGPANPFYFSTSLNRFGGAGGGALSCASWYSCLDGNGGAGGQYAILTGSTWSYGLTLIANTSGHVTDVDCASTTFCAALLEYRTSGTSPVHASWMVVDGHTRTPFAAAVDADVSCWAPYACLVLSPRSYYIGERG